jgi:hypothetical protein
MDMASSWHSFTIRAEGAYFNGRFLNIGLNAINNIIQQFQFPPLSEISFQGSRNQLIITFPFSPVIAYQKDVLSLGGGVDYQWDNYLITLTGVGSYILDYHGEPLIYDEFELNLILGLHARFWEDTLQVEPGILINPMEGLVLFRAEATYAVTDAFTVGANLLLLEGDADTPLGQFRKNDQMCVFFKYQF